MNGATTKEIKTPVIRTTDPIFISSSGMG
jgi:hypothetical protein